MAYIKSKALKRSALLNVVAGIFQTLLLYEVYINNISDES